MNRVIHFEIPADDPKKTAKFYKDVFGWEIKKWEGKGMLREYWTVKTGEEKDSGIDGAISRRVEPLAGIGIRAFICTIKVSSIDDYLQKIIEAGGMAQTSKRSIPGMGWTAEAGDIDGNIFGLLEKE